MLETGKRCISCDRNKYIKEYRPGSDQCYDCQKQNAYLHDEKQLLLRSKSLRGDSNISPCSCGNLYEKQRIGKKGTIRNYSCCYLCKSVNQGEYGTQGLVEPQRVLRRGKRESVLIGNAPKLKNVTSLVSVKNIMRT